MKKLFREDGRIAYYAGDDGKIFSLHKRTGRWLELKLRKHNTGYLQFHCWQNGKVKCIRVHRAVWEAFNGPIPSGLEINHINTIRDDNRLENLEVVTPSENHLHPPTREHKREAALKQFSNPAQHEKAREAKRHKMKPVKDVTTGVVYESIMEAARQTGLDQGSISACCRGKRRHTGGHTFAHVTEAA